MSLSLSDSDLRYVHAITRRILKDTELAADAAQDALLSAHAARAQFAGRAAYRTWLYRIAVFAALTRLRRLRQSRLVLGAALPDVADPAPTPEDALAARERIEQIAVGLATVPIPLRQVLLLRFAGRSPTEISHLLGISIANVKVRTHRAREQLRAALASDGASRDAVAAQSA